MRRPTDIGEPSCRPWSGMSGQASLTCGPDVHQDRSDSDGRPHHGNPSLFLAVDVIHRRRDASRPVPSLMDPRDFVGLPGWDHAALWPPAPVLSRPFTEGSIKARHGTRPNLWVRVRRGRGTLAREHTGLGLPGEPGTLELASPASGHRSSLPRVPRTASLATRAKPLA